MAEHVNHRDSAFSGSLSTSLILAAWARIRLWTDGFDSQVVIVISEQKVKFRLPVVADFEARTKPIATIF